MILTPRQSIRAGLLALLLALTVKQTNAEKLNYYLPTGVKYASEVVTPHKFLGFEIGDRHLQHHQLVSYIAAVAKASPRMTLATYAHTHGGRPLHLLTVSNRSNLKQWKRIQASHRRLADPQRSANVGLDELPAVINMGYSVHGNEASAGNAAALVVYHLAAARGEAIEKLLNDAVILIDPCLNPEGFDRFAHWVNANRGRLASADPAHREHHESWPSGRTNYYWFDLNRDWLPLQHPESQGRLRLYHQVKPNVVLDFHEMGNSATFFFQPGVPTRNHPLTPARTFQLTQKMAGYHSKALDQVGALYFTEERFDDFYMGKGSTYPDLHGAVGILFEQGSARGHRQQTANGLLTFSYAIRNQFLCSLSSLQATSDMRPELLEHKREFYKNSIALAQQAKHRGFVFTAPHDAARLREFARILGQHDIRCYRLNKNLTVDQHQYPAGDTLLVPADQPEYRFLLSLVERRTKFTENVFYDVSTWTLPLAFNLRYDELDKLPPRRDWELLWSQGESKRRPGLKFKPDRKDLAYVIDWRGYFAARTLNKLLQSDVMVKVARQPFRIPVNNGARQYGYGTLVVPLGIQPKKAKEIRRILSQSARQDGVDIQSMKTGLTPQGIDLGSSQFVPIPKVRVLLLVGSGVRAYEAGEVWHLLDHRFGIPATLVETSRLGSVNLKEFTAVVMVSGSYGNVSSSGKEVLQTWVRGGGNLLAIGSAANWVKETELAPVSFLSSRPSPTLRPRQPFGTARNRSAQALISGAIFATSIDTTHPVGYGFVPDKPTAPWATLPVFRNNRVMLTKSTSERQTPSVYLPSPLLSGYVSASNLSKLSNSASVAVHRCGRGTVVVIAENPNFRAFWYGTNRLFLNSLLFGGMM